MCLVHSKIVQTCVASFMDDPISNQMLIYFQISDWRKEKDEMSPGRNVVALNKEDLLHVDPTKTDYLLGK